MGRAMVESFHAEGALVAAADLEHTRAQEVADAAGDDKVAAFAVDVADPAGVAAFGDAVLARFGAVDVLCSNAGLHDNYVASLETDLQLWNRILAVNLTGHYLVTNRFLPTMIERGRGVILITASTAAFNAGGGGAAYTASKHGLIGLTRQLALDYGAKGVRVNAICPGGFATEMTRHLWSGDDRNPAFDEYIASSPAGRWGEPSEVADLALFLASDASRFLQGVPIVIDGGQSLR